MDGRGSHNFGWTHFSTRCIATAGNSIPATRNQIKHLIAGFYICSNAPVSLSDISLCDMLLVIDPHFTCNLFTPRRS